MLADDITGTVVVGLGRTGLACVRHLRSSAVPVVVADSRTDPPGLAELAADHPEVPVCLGPFAIDAFVGASTLVVSPGLSPDEPALARARDAGVELVGDIELFAREARAPVVAITGSNGKSSVTSLVGEMARRAGMEVRVGGNLGPPALSLLDGGPVDLYVLELSSFQLESTTSLCPAVAAVLNLSPDHLDRHGDLESYAEAKRRVLRGARVQVLNRDDPRVLAMRDPLLPVALFTFDEPGTGEWGVRRHAGRSWLANGAASLLPVARLRTAGRHNVANALAALAIGEAVELPRAAMVNALMCFGGLPHRCELVGERDGVRYINDSKGTNVGATVAAIEGIGPEGPLVLIAGGDGKGADFVPLRAPVAANARAVVVFGRDGGLVRAAIGTTVPVTDAPDLAAAVAAARRIAEAGDTVLFSPACASYDMFPSYEARGDAFRRLVSEAIAG